MDFTRRHAEAPNTTALSRRYLFGISRNPANHAIEEMVKRHDAEKPEIRNRLKTKGTNMNTSLKNKVALVTGGTSGIGEAVALQLAKAGANVVVAGRRESEGQAVVKAIEKADGLALFVKTDVSREADVRALVDKTLATFGRLDFAFNNAGVEGKAGLKIGRAH